MDKKIALQKATHYCALQERTVSDVRSKLMTWKVPIDLHEELIEYLLEHDFINHKRYAEVYAQSKLRYNQWGKIKIGYALKQKQLNDDEIEYGLQQIDDEEYIETIKTLITKKEKTTKGKTPKEIKYKVINYIINKGFELDIVKNNY